MLGRLSSKSVSYLMSQVSSWGNHLKQEKKRRPKKVLSVICLNRQSCIYLLLSKRRGLKIHRYQIRESSHSQLRLLQTIKMIIWTWILEPVAVEQVLMSHNLKVAKKKRRTRSRKTHPLKTLHKIPSFDHLLSSLGIHLPRWLLEDAVFNNLIEHLGWQALQDQDPHLAWCRHPRLGRNSKLKKRALINWPQIFRRNKSLRSKKMSNPLTLSQPLHFLRPTLGQRI